MNQRIVSWLQKFIFITGLVYFGLNIANAGLTTVLNIASTSGGTITAKNLAIDCGTLCSSFIPLGTRATLEVKPQSGYILNQISGCGGIWDGLTYITEEIQYSCTIHAVFIPDPDIFIDFGDAIDEAINMDESGLVQTGTGVWTADSYFSIGGGAPRYSAFAPTIENNQFSGLQYTTTLTKSGVVDFQFKIATEESHSFFSFYIDGVEQAQWSGFSENYMTVSFPVSAGEHTFEWRYEKKSSTSASQELVLLDFIRIRPNITSMGFESGNLTHSNIHNYSDNSGIYTLNTWSLEDEQFHGFKPYSGNYAAWVTVDEGSHTLEFSALTDSGYMDFSLLALINVDKQISFFIDDILQSNYGATFFENEFFREIDWINDRFLVSSGNHTFKWVVEVDDNENYLGLGLLGSQVVLLDNINLPGEDGLIPSFLVTSSNSLGGTISPSQPQSVLIGEVTTFTITPDEQYILDTVTGCDGTLLGNTYTTAAITADCQLQAGFYKKPMADAGEDRWGIPSQQVILDGSLSRTDSSIVNVRWQQLSGAPVEIESANLLTTAFMVPEVAAEEALVFSLEVTDERGLQSIDNVAINIDPQVPQVHIISPESGDVISGQYPLIAFGATTEESGGSGVSGVAFQLMQTSETHAHRYWGPVLTTMGWQHEPFWLDAAHASGLWSKFATDVRLEGGTYTLTARVRDGAGNEGYDSLIFSKNSEQTATSVTINTASQTLLRNDTLDISGQLSRLPDNGISMANQSVHLTVSVTTEDGTDYSYGYSTKTYDQYGHYQFSDLESFPFKGNYQLTLSFPQTPQLASSIATTSILVGEEAGYAIIVQGKIPNEEGLDSHHKTTRRIYQTLKTRGLVDENIYFLNYDLDQSGVDAETSWDNLKYAMTQWLPERVNGSPAPIYMILVDHGNPDIFYMGDETLTSTTMDDWFDILESKLDKDALIEPRTLIYGACYSGSFIPALSAPGRIILTSSSPGELSYKGTMENDGVRSGEYFLEALFRKLEQGKNLQHAFKEATQLTEIFTRQGDLHANSLPPYFDGAVQHPLLDDNGDGVGNNRLDAANGDGLHAGQVYLGAGLDYDTNSLENPAEVVEVASSQHLDVNESHALLWLRANKDIEVGTAWVEIRSLNQLLNAAPSSGQVALELPRLQLEFNRESGLWEGTYDAFIEAGSYELYYYVKDIETDDLSPMVTGRIYKNKLGNHSPTPPILKSPDVDATVSTTALFRWEKGHDSDGDFITYNHIVSDSEGREIYRQEGLTTGVTFIDQQIGLKDLTEYRWSIETVDQYGMISGRATRSFQTNNANGIFGIIRGQIYNHKKVPIPSALVSVGNQTTTTDNRGSYTLLLMKDSTQGLVEKEGYFSKSDEVFPFVAGGVTTLNFQLESATDNSDRDSDGVEDTIDNCPDEANSEQLNSDNDLLGEGALRT